jgi:hypothetical protein
MIATDRFVQPFLFRHGQQITELEQPVLAHQVAAERQAR